MKLGPIAILQILWMIIIITLVVLSFEHPACGWIALILVFPMLCIGGSSDGDFGDFY